MFKVWISVCAACLLLAGANCESAAQNFRGGIAGQIEDASHARVARAAIAVTPVESPTLTRSIVADAQGAFRVDDLLPGSYTVTVTANGFAPASATVKVPVGTLRELRVELRPPSVTQSVSVTGQGSSITTPDYDTTSATHQAIVTTKELETLPLAARSFANIAYLAPGTEPVEPSDPTKARITAVSTGGSSGLNIEQSVDGIDNSDDYIGGFLQNFSPDAIQEFAIKTAQEDTDTARTTGASTVLSTRRGTGVWHGGAAFFDRESGLNARFPIENPAPNPKQPFSRQNYVGTLGGPIATNKLWFFASTEIVHENASIAYSPESQTQFAALAQLASEGLIPGVTSIPVGPYVGVPFRDQLATLRLDWAQSERSQWFARGAVDSYITRNALVQQAALPSTGATSHNNYLNFALNHQYQFSSMWVGTAALGASGLHLTEARNTNLGFALAFPFTATSATISGLETFGDQQFITPITAFPVLRNQEKYQARYDLRHTMGRHSATVGISLIHEPVLSGALAATQETLVSFPMDPVDYLANPAQFTADYAANAATTPAGDGSFSQNVQRLGVFFEDSWRAAPSLTVNYGLRWDTTFGLLRASGHTQAANPAALTLKALDIPVGNYAVGAAQDDRKQFGPRIGLAWAPAQLQGPLKDTVVRAGIGLYFNDLAQNGWVTAFQAVNSPLAGPCAAPGDPGCVGSAASAGPDGNVGGSGALIDPHYETPYAVHITAGVQHNFNRHWTASIDYTHQQGNHGYRRYQYQAGYTLFSPLFAAETETQRNIVPNFTVFRTDNRSSYNALMLHVQGNVSTRLTVVGNYTYSKAATWGCVLGELFDYVNGVCNPLNAFAPGDYGPSGEDVTHRAVIAGTLRLPGSVELSTISQAESARPFTLTTGTYSSVTGDSSDNRAVVNGQPVAMDGLRGTPYIQFDLRVSRPTKIGEKYTLTPFFEFFNLLNRNNPGANYVTDVAALPVPQGEVAAGNVTDVCANADCSVTKAITSLKQLRLPGGALGDFFGPGTTVGIPFAGQFGARFSF
jgi:hypothetical protein